MLNLAYQDTLFRNVVTTFLASLRAPVRSLNDADGSDFRQGCGLSFVARQIEEHYSDTAHRSNNLSARLIGRQAIALEGYGYRLIDILERAGGSPGEAMRR